MSDDFFDQMKAALGGMAAKAEIDLLVQSFSWSSNGWQDITRDGKRVGRFRFEAAEITIAPKAKRKPAKRKTPAKSK